MHTYIDTLLRSNTHKCVAINAATHTYTHTHTLLTLIKSNIQGLSLEEFFGVFSVNDGKKKINVLQYPQIKLPQNEPFLDQLLLFFQNINVYLKNSETHFCS